LRLFSFEHSARSYRADIVLYGIAVALLAGSTWATAPDGQALVACGHDLPLGRQCRQDPR
jgi:hypothetical protein